MIKFDGMKSEAFSTAYPMLPAGPYVAKIMTVKIDGTAPDQTLVLRMEITEGEHAGYFRAKYEHDQNSGGKFAPKYRGDFKLRIPNKDRQSSFENAYISDLRKFNDATWRIEQSNPGYTWDGDETKLVGKTVGISMQEGSYNDRPFTSIARLETADDVRKGLVKVMNPRKPAFSSDHQPAAPVYTPVDDAEIPF